MNSWAAWAWGQLHGSRRSLPKRWFCARRQALGGRAWKSLAEIRVSCFRFAGARATCGVRFYHGACARQVNAVLGGKRRPLHAEGKCRATI